MQVCVKKAVHTYIFFRTLSTFSARFLFIYFFIHGICDIQILRYMMFKLSSLAFCGYIVVESGDVYLSSEWEVLLVIMLTLFVRKSHIYCAKQDFPKVNQTVWKTSAKCECGSRYPSSATNISPFKCKEDGLYIETGPRSLVRFIEGSQWT